MRMPALKSEAGQQTGVRTIFRPQRILTLFSVDPGATAYE